MLHLRAGRVGHVLGVGVQVLVYVFIDRPHARDIVDTLNALQLLFVELSDKIFLSGAVLLERILSNLRRLSVDSVVPIKDFLGDGNLVR